MITRKMDMTSPTVQRLIENRAASRVQAKDASLYAFAPASQACAERFMGWADLASNPPFPPAEVQRLADEIVADGFTHAVLIGQGGSTQAPMTITKYRKADGINRVDFRVIDSDSPVRVRKLMADIDPAHTLIIVSSKSGTTLEPRMMFDALGRRVAAFVPEGEFPRHLIAITDPGSQLDKEAREQGWRAVLPGEPTVGGRFSALSVFGLFPAALVGIDLEAFMARARAAEERCAADSPDNPALALAAFLFDNWQAGRGKFSFLTPKRGRVFDLWIEQLVAESLGKDGKGILPGLEIDPLLLAKDPGDRCVITYRTKNHAWNDGQDFDIGLSVIDKAIPAMDFEIGDVEELADHFIMWEYATAMCGWLMEVCPFDQPDVQITKTRVLTMLEGGLPEPDFSEAFPPLAWTGELSVRVSPAASACAPDGKAPATLREALRALFAGVRPGDYFALDAFLPFAGEGRREALEGIRHEVAERLGVAACLEIGPRYLHSVGQLQKGGPDNGVFLVLTADEMRDIPLAEVAPSLGKLAKTQGIGDWAALSERGRRAVHVNLPDNGGVALRAFAAVVRDVLAELVGQ